MGSVCGCAAGSDAVEKSNEIDKQQKKNKRGASTEKRKNEAAGRSNPQGTGLKDQRDQPDVRESKDEYIPTPGTSQNLRYLGLGKGDRKGNKAAAGATPGES